MQNKIEERFSYDAVIILSMSDWYTEMRSNRYHFATRFAKIAPTFFVQDYRSNQNILVAGTEDKITIVNPIYGYSYESLYLILELAINQGAKKVLFWLYTPYYFNVLQQVSIPYFTVFHATEAYLDSDMITSEKNEGAKCFIDLLKKTINSVDFTISVSDGISKALLTNRELFPNIHTISNGCDYKFWNGFHYSQNNREKAVLYQGGIHTKIDFSLLVYLAEKNTDIAFWFCGESYFIDSNDKHLWDNLLKHSNVTYFGKLPVEKVRELSHRAKVGIIPFKKNDWLIKKAFPLKAFEYLSSGLEVISTPIEALLAYQNFFFLCNSYEEFNLNLRKAIAKNAEYTPKRVKLCEEQDYSIKFEKVLNLIDKHAINEKKTYIKDSKKRILILYDINYSELDSMREQINSFGLFSRNEVTYYRPILSPTISQTFLNSFDVIILHYSLQFVEIKNYSKDLYNKLKTHIGKKILFINNSVICLANAVIMLKGIKFDLVFTSLDSNSYEYVNNHFNLANEKIISYFPSYVSYENHQSNFPLIKNRNIDIYYRFFDGSTNSEFLESEKQKIEQIFESNNKFFDKEIALDIKSESYSFTSKVSWYKTLSNCKAVIVYDLNITASNLQYLFSHLYNDSFSNKSQVHRVVKDCNSGFQSNNFSSIVLDIITSKTVLILKEDSYPKILKPYLHYIPIKKDFVNVLEIFEILKNDDQLQQIANQTYSDIILNEAYSYKFFVNNIFDKVIDDAIFITKRNVFPSNLKLSFVDYIEQLFFNKNVIEKNLLGGAPPSIVIDEYETISLEYDRIKGLKGKLRFYRLLSKLPTNYLKKLVTSFKIIRSFVR